MTPDIYGCFWYWLFNPCAAKVILAPLPPAIYRARRLLKRNNRGFVMEFRWNVNPYKFTNIERENVYFNKWKRKKQALIPLQHWKLIILKLFPLFLPAPVIYKKRPMNFYFAKYTYLLVCLIYSTVTTFHLDLPLPP